MDPVAAAATSSKDRYVAFAFARADILIEILGDGTITFITGAVQAMLGMPASALIGQPISKLIGRDEQGALKRIIAATRAGDRLNPIPLTLNPGSRRLNGNIAGCPLPSATGHYFLSFSSLAALTRPVAASERDAGTGLLNKEGFANAAQHYLNQPSANGAARRVTLLDIDGPANVSTQASIGSALQDLGVEGDAIGMVAPNRFGVIHEAGIDSKLIQRQLIEKMKAIEPNGLGKVKSSSFELSAGSQSAADAAKALVYAINKFAEDQSGDFNIESLEGLDRFIDSSVTKIQDLRRALRNFTLHYQPIVDLKTGLVHHQEALTRLADGGSPFSTVTFAEEAGLIADLDIAVTQHAVEVLQRSPSAVDIAINLSGRSLGSDGFVKQLEAQLSLHNNFRHRLIIEITESSRINDLDRISAIITSLQQAGHKICIDDFGSGAAAFHYLRKLRVDTVKIDGQYISKLKTDPRDRAFVKSIQQLATDLGCSTVAEFVETEDQIGVLRALGVDYGQGYLFARPQPEIYTRENLKPKKSWGPKVG